MMDEDRLDELMLLDPETFERVAAIRGTYEKVLKIGAPCDEARAEVIAGYATIYPHEFCVWALSL